MNVSLVYSPGPTDSVPDCFIDGQSLFPFLFYSATQRLSWPAESVVPVVVTSLLLPTINALMEPVIDGDNYGG